MVFTGIYEVGMRLYRGFTQDYPRPIITEMGGKNPAIVTANADLDEAAEGVMRSAFGFDGQKCSRQLARLRRARRWPRAFVDKLVEKTRAHPRRRPDRARELDGPGHQPARARHVQRPRSPRRRPTAARSRSAARSCATAAERGFFPTPTVVTGLPLDHRLFRDELFVPFLVVGEVDSLDQALERGERHAPTA